MHTKEQLKEQLRAMGIRPDDTVMIHISLRAVGPVENGADGVIDAFKECLPEGLFLVPTHSWANVNRENPVYDVRSTPACIGVLPQVAAFRPDGIRSLHPTHSIWACGKGAAEFVAGEENCPTPGMPGFAWERLRHVGTKILLIGVGHERNTFIHAVEEVADVPDRISQPFDVTVIDYDGNSHTHPYSNHYCSRHPHVSEQFPNFDKAFDYHGVQKIGKLGNADVKIVDAAKCAEVVLKIWSRATEDLCIRMMDLPEELYK